MQVKYLINSNYKDKHNRHDKMTFNISNQYWHCFQHINATEQSIYRACTAYYILNEVYYLHIVMFASCNHAIITFDNLHKCYQ